MALRLIVWRYGGEGRLRQRGRVLILRGGFTNYGTRRVGGPAHFRRGSHRTATRDRWNCRSTRAGARWWALEGHRKAGVPGGIP